MMLTDWVKRQELPDLGLNYMQQGDMWNQWTSLSSLVHQNKAGFLHTLVWLPVQRAPHVNEKREDVRPSHCRLARLARLARLHVDAEPWYHITDWFISYHGAERCPFPGRSYLLTGGRGEPFAWLETISKQETGSRRTACTQRAPWHHFLLVGVTSDAQTFVFPKVESAECGRLLFSIRRRCWREMM